MTLSPVVTSAKILIADESALQRNLLSGVLARKGFCVLSACNGREAFDLFIQEQPDLAILDIIMPAIDGITVAKKIRSVSCDDYIPIIFITSSKNNENLDRCIDVGGDDYIDKALNEEVLLVKIQSLLRLKALYQAQLSQKKNLLKYQELIQQEREIAANLYTNILRLGFVDAPILRYSLSPMALFNGDILLSAKAPGNQLYLLLGDFTGHGLSASVGASPAAEIFYGMVRKGFAVTEIALEINRKLYKLLPTSMFLAATFVTLNSETNLLQIISCGLPEHYLLNRVTRELKSIPSKNLPLGIVSTFEPSVQSYKVTGDHYLYLFSDGLIEAENPQGQQFTTQGVRDCLKASAPSYFDWILECLQQHAGGREQQDDVTLVELQCDPSHLLLQEAIEIEKQERIAMDWNSSMRFTLQTLKYLQPVPILVNFLMEIQGLQRFRIAIFQIVNELFLNALDYGLLAMDSSMKQSTEGLAFYNQIKMERLNNLHEGEIQFVFNHIVLPDGGRLTISVLDSGAGFNVEEMFSIHRDRLRGIRDVQALCTRLEYMGCGNHVNAVFEWRS